jgi:GINS complex subunit 4
MEKHLEQSVLSKLPYGYDSVTRQSLSSTEDDMGIPLDLEISMFLCHAVQFCQFVVSDVTEAAQAQYE